MELKSRNPFALNAMTVTENLSANAATGDKTKK